MAASATPCATTSPAFEEAVDTLVIKCLYALEAADRDRLVIAGGVSANKRLRDVYRALAERGARVFYARPEFCTDNGAMIAYAGALDSRPASKTTSRSRRGRAAHGHAPGDRVLSDRIELRRLQVDTVIGVYAWERGVRQRLYLDLDLPTDAAVAAEDLSKTVDHDAVSSTSAPSPRPNTSSSRPSPTRSRRPATSFGLPWIGLVIAKPGAVADCADVRLRIRRRWPGPAGIFDLAVEPMRDQSLAKIAANDPGTSTDCHGYAFTR